MVFPELNCSFGGRMWPLKATHRLARMTNDYMVHYCLYETRGLYTKWGLAIFVERNAYIPQSFYRQNCGECNSFISAMEITNKCLYRKCPTACISFYRKQKVDTFTQAELLATVLLTFRLLESYWNQWAQFRRRNQYTEVMYGGLCQCRGLPS